uniref:Uncharacterized protein n=1 Tax=Anolis carolinensis TaxID=28377 RepID=A0A803TS03_ANOCA
MRNLESCLGLNESNLHVHFLKTLENRTDVSVMRTPYDWKHEKGMGLTIPL